jgi:diphthine-ammonia ligase
VRIVIAQDMAAAGLRSVLVKVASLGLREGHLGQPIAQMCPYLISLADRYGCNACGEGGEYETLTLDGPMFQHGHIALEVRCIHFELL